MFNMWNNYWVWIKEGYNDSYLESAVNKLKDMGSIQFILVVF